MVYIASSIQLGLYRKTLFKNGEEEKEGDLFVVKYITAALTKESGEETISHELLRPGSRCSLQVKKCVMIPQKAIKSLVR